MAEHLELAMTEIKSLLADPWFSSLWTLQEGYLRQDSFLFSQEGSLIRLSDCDWHVTLLDLLDYCRILLETCEESECLLHNQPPSQLQHLGLVDLINSKGLAALASLIQWRFMA